MPEAAKDVKAAATKAAPAKKETKAAAAPAKKDAAKPAAAKPAAAKPAAAAAPAKKVEAVKTDKPVVEKTAKAVVTKPAAKPKKSVTAAAATATGKVGKKAVLRGKGLKKKKVSLRYAIDCTNIAEDNILDVADFVSTPDGKNRLYFKNSCYKTYIMFVPPRHFLLWLC